MQFEITREFDKGEIIVKFAFENDFPEVENEVRERFNSLIKKRVFEGKLLQMVKLSLKEREMLVIGLGKKEKYVSDYLRRAAIQIYKFASSLKAHEVLIELPLIYDEEENTQALVEGIIIASYPLDIYKSEREKIEDIKFLIKGASVEKIKRGLKLGKIYAEAQNFARELSEKPANILTPLAFAEEALKLAKEKGLKIEIFKKADLEKMGMNGILAVGKGSENEPVLIYLEYEGGGPRVAVIGKGVTFDSGGISLKPSKNMHEMRYDKSGAAITLGVLKAVSELKLNVNLIGIIPLVENLPSGKATRPGDIIKMYSGKTVEILNTDAEGRLILADAVSYAVEKKAEYIIDVATLTGAIIVSLGKLLIGMFTNDKEFGEIVKEAGEKTYERVWELPTYEEYAELIKGDFADIKNIGPEGEAGSIVGAMFIKEFVGNAKWVHLDIAGVDCSSGKNTLIEKGATGTGTRLIIQTIKQLSEKNKK